MSEYADQIAGLLAGLSVLLMIAGYARILERRHLAARLKMFVGTGSLGERAPSGDRTTRSLRRWSARGRLRLGARPSELSQAGVSVTPRRFLFVQLAAGMAGLVLARLLATPIGMQGAGFLLLLAIGVVVGLAVPRFVLRVKRSRRFAQFERQLSSALDSIASAMEVGLSLPQALESISRDMPAPLGPEFGQIVRGLGMGLPLGEALDGLAERVPLRDVEIFVTAVHIQYRTGGALSHVLRNIANTVRERVNLRGEIRAMTSQQRLSAYLISGLPLVIALAIKVLSPAYFERLLEPGLIRGMLLAAGIGIVAGFYFMMRIADIEV